MGIYRYISDINVLCSIHCKRMSSLNVESYIFINTFYLVLFCIHVCVCNILLNTYKSFSKHKRYMNAPETFCVLPVFTLYYFSRILYFKHLNQALYSLLKSMSNKALYSLLKSMSLSITCIITKNIHLHL